MSMRRRRNDEAGGAELAELAALADGSLPPGQRAALEARVAESSELAGQLAEQRRAVALLQGAAAEVEAPTVLRERIESLQAPRRRPPRRRVLAAAGAAAAIVVAVVAVWAVLRTGTQSASFRAALAPTGLAPGASGDATLTRTSSGWRIDLDATGLPLRSGGLFYEAWLRSPAGVLVPVGTFNEGSKVTLWAGVSPKEFPTLTVTREQADGNQGSSGEKVLVGTVKSGG